MKAIPLIVLHLWEYQYHQIKPFIDKLGPCMVVARQTVEEKNNSNSGGGYRIVDQTNCKLGDNKYNEKQLLALGVPFDYVLFTGKPFKAIDKLAEASNRGFCAYIGHSLICSRYDTSLHLPSTPHCIGLMPKCWEDFECVKKEMKVYDESHFIQVDTIPLAYGSIATPPTVEVEKGTVGVVFGCRSAFGSYYTLLKDLINLNHEVKKVKVKFHPLTRPEENPAIALMEEDPDFEILPIDSDKYEFIDSCEFIIGGCSSLLIEAVVRNQHFQLGQRISKFKEKRGINLEMVEDTLDFENVGNPPHKAMVNFKDTEEMFKYLMLIINSLFFDEELGHVVSDLNIPTITSQEFLAKDE